MIAPDYIDVSALLLLVAANSAPVLATRMLGQRCDTAIDAGKRLFDGRPVFGAHKTWRGLIASVVVTGIVGVLLKIGFPAGAAFGALAMLGDLTSSFVKRRMSHGSGHSVPVLDQLPEALLPLVISSSALGITVSEIVGTTLAFALLDMVTQRLRPPEQAQKRRPGARRAR